MTAERVDKEKTGRTHLTLYLTPERTEVVDAIMARFPGARSVSAGVFKALGEWRSLVADDKPIFQFEPFISLIDVIASKIDSPEAKVAVYRGLFRHILDRLHLIEAETLSSFAERHGKEAVAAAQSLAEEAERVEIDNTGAPFSRLEWAIGRFHSLFRDRFGIPDEVDEGGSPDGSKEAAP